MKNRLQNEYEDIWRYMNQWIDTEEWDDMQIMSDAASVGCSHALEHMADFLVGTGCISPTQCYPECKTLEEDILLLAKRYRKLSQKQKDLVYDRIFDGVLFVDCEECNHCSFINDGNEELYPEVAQKCWSCNSSKINVERYKAKRKIA